MANSTNKGNQRQRIQYGQRISSKQENQGFYQIIPDGIYSGFTLTNVSGSVEIAPGVCFISDPDNALSLRVETLSAYVMISEVTEVRPYITLVYDWVDSKNNYMDFIAKSSGEIVDSDIIVGKATYSGGVLQSVFDYSERDTSPLTFLSSVNDILTIGGNLTINGNLEVLGTQVTIETQTVEIEDNIMLLNSTQTGTPSTSLQSGLEVERGDLTNQRLIFNENDDQWKIGEIGSEQTIVKEGNTFDITGLINGTGIVNALGEIDISVGNDGIALMDFDVTVGNESITMSALVHVDELLIG